MEQFQLTPLMIGFGLFAVVWFVLFLVFGVLVFFPWMRAQSAGGQVSIFDVLGMRLRGNPTGLLIDAYVALLQSGVPTTIREVEAAYIVHKDHVRTADDLVRLIRVQRGAP